MFILIGLCFSFFDFLAEKGEDAAETAAIASATADLVSVVGGSEEIIRAMEDIEWFASAVEDKIDESIYLSEETKRLMKGVDYSSDRLSTNIRYTTSYIRRLQSLFLRYAAFGSDFATAINTLETNVSLSEIQKNQQTMIMMERQKSLLELNEKLIEHQKSEAFIDEQRKKRWRMPADG